MNGLHEFHPVIEGLVMSLVHLGLPVHLRLPHVLRGHLIARVAVACAHDEVDLRTRSQD